MSLLQADCPLVKHLGSGACGSVDLHQMQMAVKKASTPRDQQVLNKESVALLSMNHPSIPKLLCFVARSDGSFGIGMNFISGGSLEEAIWCARTPHYSLLCCHSDDGRGRVSYCLSTYQWLFNLLCENSSQSSKVAHGYSYWKYLEEGGDWQMSCW